MSMTVWLDS
uniref:Uncharacterized protein n=1 Tax=Anguilla anguilla TaxID=7936 RepID=A0A0E9UXW6_ANGAN